jgi:PhnB protein
MAVNPIPEGHHTITPYLTVRGAGALIEFVKKAFGATLIYEMKRPDGSIGHAEVKIGDSMVMIGETPDPSQAMPAMLHLYVADSDAWYNRAIAAGATVVREIADQFYGDRSGGVKDMCGNQWWLSTHVEDVSPEEMDRRMAAMAKS